MKKLITLGAAALALVAAPAYAQTNEDFTGFRVGVTAGADDVTGVRDTTDIVYGVDAGVDVGIGDRVTLGVEAFSTNPFEDERTVGAAARVGYAITPDVLGFVRAGYSNYQDTFSRKLDGLTVGGGAEFALSDMSYARIEYRHSNFEEGVGNHGVLAGVGLRF